MWTGPLCSEQYIQCFIWNWSLSMKVVVNDRVGNDMSWHEDRSAFQSTTHRQRDMALFIHVANLFSAGSSVQALIQGMIVCRAGTWQTFVCNFLTSRSPLSLKCLRCWEIHIYMGGCSHYSKISRQKSIISGHGGMNFLYYPKILSGTKTYHHFHRLSTSQMNHCRYSTECGGFDQLTGCSQKVTSNTTHILFSWYV